MTEQHGPFLMFLICRRDVPYGICGNSIVGSYRNEGEDVLHGFIYTIPEPATLFLLGLGWRFVRRKR